MSVISNAVSSRNAKEKTILLPLHKYPELKEQCITILNKQWTRSETLRYRSLDSSCDQLPTSLVLVDSTSEIPMVLGHSRLNCIPNERETVWIESVIIHHEYRSKGYGTVLMRKTEEYAASLGFKIATLSTHGEEKFYEKLGYEFSYPVCIYGGTVNRLFLPNTSLPWNITTNVNNEKFSGLAITTKANNINLSHSSNLVPLIFNNSNIPSPPPPPPPQLQSYHKKTKLKTSDIQRINDKNVKTYMRKKIAV